MRRAAITIALAIAASGASAQESAAQVEQRRVFELLAGVTAAQNDERGVVFLELWPQSMRFRLAGLPEDKLQQMAALVRQAYDEGRSIRIRYDGAEGRLSRETGRIEYPACAVILGIHSFEPPTPCATAPAGAGASGEKALALSIAHANAGQYAIARDMAARAGTSDDAAFRKLLLRARSDAVNGLARLERPNSPSADRLAMDAMNDLKALAALDPDDFETEFAVGYQLEMLGGYAEAKRHYEGLLKRFPDEDFRISIRVGALYRQQGDYARALAELDQLVARQGPQGGMRYHYHRGWTLSLLGRFDEAIAQFDEGLKSQPDYSSAYILRSCAHASAGHLREALADVEEGTRLLSAIPDAGPSIQGDLRHAATVAARLKQAIAARVSKPMPGTCAGYAWGLDSPRARSPLLPAT